jgi:CRISPR-associated endonuclease/helicase Cas3
MGNQNWTNCRTACLDQLISIMGLDSLPVLNPSSKRMQNAILIRLAGLCTQIDWTGSQSCMQHNTEIDATKYYNDALINASRAIQLASPLPPKKRLASGVPFITVFPNMSPRPLQALAEKIALTNWKLMIVEAPMGDGKTELALYAIREMIARGKKGFYFALPTQSTSNRMFARIVKFLEGCGESPEIHLLHNRAEFIDSYTDSKNEWRKDKDSDAWFADTSKRKLMMGQGVGTIDQILTSVMFA